jgi:4-amino-4-deoxy-L-arabinose transferase-like glycosyltransferase
MDEATHHARSRATSILLLALTVGALVRASLLVYAGGLEPRIVDEQHYIELADSLYEGRGFAWADGQATSIRPPLYPAFVASIWTIAGGRSLVAVRVVQMGLALVTVWLVYRLGASMFDEGTGAAAALAVALYPSLLFANVTLLTETLFTFLLVSTMWLCHVALRDRSLAKAAMAGTCCGLAALTRSVLWPFPLVAASVILFAAGRSWRRGLAMAAVFCACHAAVLSPWSVRNSSLQGVFVAVDTLSGFNLWMANSEGTPSDRMWAAVSQGGDQRMAAAIASEFPGRRLTEGEKDKWGREAALRFMLSHPAVTATRSLRKFGDFWGLDRELLAGIAQGVYSPPRLAGLLMGAAVMLAYPAAMVLAVIGIWLSRKRNWPTHVMVGALILFVCAVHTIVFGHSRYRLPLMPFLLIYAAAAVCTQSWRMPPASRWRVAGAGTMIAALGAIWIQEVLIRDADRVRALLTHLMP